MDSEDMCGVKRIELPPSASTHKHNNGNNAASDTAAAALQLPTITSSTSLNNGYTHQTANSSSSNDVPAVKITNGSFAWDAGSAAVLNDVSLEVPKGSLVIVVGPVGSGKSSLLSAVLGEMAAVGQQQQPQQLQGEEGLQQQQEQQRQHPVTVAGSVAYTAQVSGGSSNC
jgi:ABC-type transport system involved in cytochrome bd biosynthesis fused ATPase/permease subunit